MARPKKAASSGYDYDIGIEEGIAQYREASEKAKTRASRKGLLVDREIPLYEGDEYCGRLPANYADFDLNDLSKLLAVTTEWAGYVEGLHLQAKAEKGNLEKQLKLAKAKVRKSKVGSKDEKEDASICDTRYVDVSVGLEEVQEYVAIVEANYLAAKRDREAVSRIATMRGQQMEHGARVNNAQYGNEPRSPRMSAKTPAAQRRRPRRKRGG